MVIRGAVFDLDDTLYHERDYVRSGFSHVADLVGRSRVERRAMAGWLAAAFEAGQRGDTFDRFLDAFPEIRERFSVESLVEVYRCHRPAIGLANDVESTLDVLRASGLRLGIVSDGPLVSQTAKADALDLARWFDPIVFTDSIGPGHGKPATTAFKRIASAWRLSPESLVYVADNPEKDFVGPRSLGWLTVRLRQQEQLRFRLEPLDALHRPDSDIGSITSLLEILQVAGQG